MGKIVFVKITAGTFRTYAPPAPPPLPPRVNLLMNNISFNPTVLGVAAFFLLDDGSFKSWCLVIGERQELSPELPTSAVHLAATWKVLRALKSGN